MLNTRQVKKIVFSSSLLSATSCGFSSGAGGAAGVDAGAVGTHSTAFFNVCFGTAALSSAPYVVCAPGVPSSFKGQTSADSLSSAANSSSVVFSHSCVSSLKKKVFLCSHGKVHCNTLAPGKARKKPLSKTEWLMF